MEKTEVKYVAADLSGLEDNPKLVPDTDFMTARSQLRKKKRRSCSLYAAVIALLATAGMFCVCLVWLYGSPRLGEDVLEEIEPARRSATDSGLPSRDRTYLCHIHSLQAN